ncbi:serine/threonine-protein kinase [Stackebrandtia albiflava]|uniref:non-specific serine/threonine protein kinase n=1 Tax=Stackebrandtia albiflava TaxID=406432 RepID=A0A562V0X1_9ACTN|nr:serine/threonine-protein kinase [Stackebrandtia albiflava]TWJ11528.1 serine/threonine-protein kinase [Stackebrandtia albiflava]
MMTPGSKLGGRYRLDRRIATGGMGDVWRATDEVLGREVAAKVLLPSLLNEPGFVERFRGEARVVATLTHPNIVRVYDYGESPMPGGGQVAYLIMEFIDGEALTARLQRQGRLTAQEAMPIIAQAAEALDAAHQRGVIHRDVKPGNLLLSPQGNVMLTDFGIARSALTGGLTQAGSVLGTAAYISPEQASGQPITGQADVYSLGIVAYQCLAGRRPFDSDNPVELAMRHVNDAPPPLPDDVPEPARRFVAQALAKDTAQRFPTGEAMAAAAREVVGMAGPAVVSSPARGAAVPPPGVGLDDRTRVNQALDPHTPPPVAKRNRLMLVVAGAALGLVVLAGGVWAIVDGGGAEAGDGGSDNTTQSADAEEETLLIDVGEYVNEDPQQVQAALQELGFTDVEIDGNGRFVADITPNGEQLPGTPIVIETSMTRVNPGDSQDPSAPDGSPSCTPGTIGCIPR